jgi:hypothetical protein
VQLTTARWLVLGPLGGRIVATASFPSDPQAMEIGADYRVGLRRDGEGVERVTLQPWSRNGYS